METTTATGAPKSKGSKGNKKAASPVTDVAPEATPAPVKKEGAGSPVKATKPVVVGALPPAPAPPATTAPAAPKPATGITGTITATATAAVGTAAAYVGAAKDTATAAVGAAKDTATAAVGAAKETATAAVGAAKETVVGLLSWDRWAPYLNLPVTTSFGAEAQKAAFAVENMSNSVEAKFLRELVKKADGIAFLTVAKGGVVVTGQFGSGLVVLKDAKTGKWSAPAAVGTVGGGVGPQGGWDVTDVVLFFKSESGAAADAFKGGYQLAAGVSGGVAFGPFGRQGNAHVHLRLGSKKLAVAYAFSWSKGFFLGTSVDAKLLKALSSRNASVYGPTASLEDILGGKVAPPAEAKPLFVALDKFVACAGGSQ